MEAGRLAWRDRLALAAQRAIGRLLSPLWVPLAVALMHFGLRWQIEGSAATRRQFRALVQTDDGPLVLCGNHLTLIDSALIAWALGSPGWFLTHYATLPWNVPERQNFAQSFASRILVYVMKCIPVTRGGDRDEVAAVLNRLVHLLQRGEAVLIFPEGGRSRSGRVDVENATYGVGQMIGMLPRCRVLCVYLRGEHQHSWGDLPPRGERFRVRLECLQPTSDLKGLRAARDVTHQIVHTLGRLEQQHFAEMRQ